MYCINCGKNIPADARFCPYCGEPIKNADNLLNNISFSYDDIENRNERHQYNKRRVFKNNKMGLVDTVDGFEVVPCIYDDILYLSGYFLVQRNGKWGFYENGKEIISCSFDTYYPYLHDTFIVSSNGYFGIIRRSEEGQYYTVPCKYDGITPRKYDISYDNGYFIVKENSKYGVLHLTLTGRIIVCLPVIYDSIDSYGYSNKYIVEQNGKKGVFNSEGEIFLDCKYDIIDFNFRENLMWIKLVKDSHAEIINQDKSHVKDFPQNYYEDILPSSSIQLYYVKYNAKWEIAEMTNGGLIEITQEKFDSIYEGARGQYSIIVEKNGYFGVIETMYNDRGIYLNYRMPCMFESVKPTNLNRNLNTYICKLNSKYGIYSSERSKHDSNSFLVKKLSNDSFLYKQTKSESYLVLPTPFDFHNSDSMIFIDYKYNYYCEGQKIACLEVDSSAYEVLENKYDYIEESSNGCSPYSTFILKQNSKYGAITYDESRSVVSQIPLIYDEIKKTYYGFDLLARKEDKWGAISYKGDVIIPCEYQDVLMTNYSKWIKKDNVWQEYNAPVPNTFDSIEFIKDENLIITRNIDKYGFMATDGTIYLPCDFDSYKFDPPYIILVKGKDRIFVDQDFFEQFCKLYNSGKPIDEIKDILYE